VPLSVLLERAGLEEDACEIVLEGPDRGVPKEGALPPGQVSYARSLSRAKVLQREVLIPYHAEEAGAVHIALPRQSCQWPRSA
jgi:DMSO/TMAO reductase YedYZ molybdopterin-dependent catalytic subunit